MRVVTFNVNGLRAVLKKDKSGKQGTGLQSVLRVLVNEHDPDIICLQETKCPGDLDVDLPFAFKKIVASKARKGYSGVAIFSKREPLRVYEDFPMNEEGRVLCVEFENAIVINAYVPNSKPDLSRLSYRVEEWEPTVRRYVQRMQKKKPVIFAADFNVAPTEADLHSPKGNERSHGFTLEERGAFAKLIDDCDLVDTFRALHPRERGSYTWFSNFAKSRERNRGWRIDTILASASLASRLRRAEILSDYYGSDHVPYLVEIDV